MLSTMVCFYYSFFHFKSDSFHPLKCSYKIQQQNMLLYQLNLVNSTLNSIDKRGIENGSFFDIIALNNF